MIAEVVEWTEEDASRSHRDRIAEELLRRPTRVRVGESGFWYWPRLVRYDADAGRVTVRFHPGTTPPGWAERMEFPLEDVWGVDFRPPLTPLEEAFVMLCGAIRNDQNTRGIRASTEVFESRGGPYIFCSALGAANELCRQAGVYGLRTPLASNVNALREFESVFPQAVAVARSALQGSRNILL